MLNTQYNTGVKLPCLCLTATEPVTLKPVLCCAEFSATELGLRCLYAPLPGSRPDSRWEFSNLPGKIYIKSSMSVEFKTTAREGIIFYAAAVNQIDFIALYLKNGNVSLIETG